MRNKLLWFLVLTLFYVSFSQFNTIAFNDSPDVQNNFASKQQYFSEELPVNYAYGLTAHSISVCGVIQIIPTSSFFKWQSFHFEKKALIEYHLFTKSHIYNNIDLSLCTSVIVYPHHSFG